MNFKPTLLKTIVSIFIGIISFVYLILFSRCYDVCPGLISTALINSIVIITIIYIIWSLSQNNKSNSKKRRR